MSLNFESVIPAGHRFSRLWSFIFLDMRKTIGFIFRILLTILAICLSEVCMAQSTSWTGTTDTKWRTASNWTSGVPDESTDAIIGDASFTGLFQPTLSRGSGRGKCQSLTIGNGAKVSTLTVEDGMDITGTLTIGALGTLNDDNGNIKIEGDWLNSGSYVAGGSNRRVYFLGSNQSIGGSSVTDFEKLYINSETTVTLAQDIVVSNFINLDGTLNPTAGFTVTGTGDIDIKSGGVLKVMATTFAGNYAHSGTTNPARNSSVIDYASTSVNQTVDNSITYRILQISGSMTKSLAGNTTIENDLIVNGGTLDLLGFTANRDNSGGSLTVAAGATLKIGGTNTFPSNYNTHVLATTSTVEYGGGNQTVSAEDYGSLVLSSTSGTVTKTMPSSALTVARDLTTSAAAGTLSFTAANNITILGNITLGASTTFEGSTFSHSTGGNWVNNGTYNGCGSSFSFNRAGASMSGSGTNNFGNLTINGSGTTLDQNTSLSVCGNFSTAGGGSFTHTTGGTGTFSMSGATKTIAGSNIIFDDFIVTGSGSISTSSTLVVAGDLTANGSFTANAGTIAFTGTSKAISGSAAIQLSAVTVTGTVSTTRDLSISSNFNVAGSFTATAGEVTFNGTSTFSGTANIFDLDISSSGTLIMGSGAVLGVAGVVTLNAGGNFDPTSNVPNTMNFNGTGAQSLVLTTYHNLTVSNGNTKTPPSALTINGDLTIGTGTTFDGNSLVHSLAGNWVNNGTFTSNSSTIQLTGTNDVSISGATTFDNLTLNKGTTNDVTLNDDISVSQLAMTAGGMLTETNTVTITTDRTGNGIIIGNITRDHTFSAGVDYEFEGPNNFINFTSLTGTITSIDVTVTIGPNLTFESAASVNRTYDITVNGIATYSATLRLHYEQNEVNGNDESLMTLWRRSLGTWSTAGKSANDATDNWVEQTAQTNLTNPWTLSEGLVQFSWDGSASSSWTDSDNWSPAGIPILTSIVRIGDLAFTNQPIISTSVQAKELFFHSDTESTLTIAFGGSLTVQGNIDGEWDADASHTIDVGAQSLTTLGDVVLSDGTADRNINLTASTGSITVGGALTQSGGADIIFSGAADLNIAGDFDYVDGTFTPSTSTVTYDGTGLQELGGVTYYDLVMDKSSGLCVVNSPTTVSNDLTLTTGGQLDVQSTLSVSGTIDVGVGTTLNIPTTDVINISENWVNSGTFLPGSGTVVFNGTGAQTTEAATFNNFTINKASGTLTLLGNVTINGDIDVQSGTVEVATFDVSRSVTGGLATLGPGTTARFGGSGVQINNFGSLQADPTSTVEFYSTDARIIPPITYGNLIISNGGANAKTMVGPTTVGGNLTVNSGSTLVAPSSTLTLEGDFTMNGTFNASTGTLIMNGTGNVNGDITYNDLVVNGAYVLQAGSANFDGNLDVTATGDLNTGSLNVISNGNFTNSGSVTSNGVVTFLGTQTQTIRLLSAITSESSGVINFNGTVSPVLNSTSSPNFATVNINNTAPIVASQPWSVFFAMNIASGATWNGGPLTHTFHRNFDNNGTVISSGKLVFSASSAASVNLGTNFTTTNEIEFAGTEAITLTDNSPNFESVLISNTNAAGITPSTAWTIAQDLFITTGAKLNGSSLSHTVSGQWTNNGTFDGQTSTITFNSTEGTDAIKGAGATTFYNLIFDTNTVMDIISDISVLSNFTNNATTLSFIDQSVKFEGSAASVLGGATSTNFDDLEIDKSSNGLQLAIDAGVDGFLILTDGTLDLNSNTLSITNSEATAVSRTSGYVLSESTSFASTIDWTIGTDLTEHEFPFGTSLGDYIPFLFDLNSGDAGTVSVATYGTGADNMPMPPGVTNINNTMGKNNSANTVDRYFLINLSGATSPNVDVTFNAGTVEVGTITTLQAQRWGSDDWEMPKAGQVAGATSVMVPGVTQFSPWAMSGNGMPLPVELINFEVKQVENHVVLNWETASEQENDFFEIQKSLDGTGFFRIDEVKGVGNSNSRQTYSYTDYSLSPGQSYYRLKQVDFDGSISYSEIVLLQANADYWSLSIYPNPATDYVIVSSSEAFGDKVTLQLYDQLGNILRDARDVKTVQGNQQMISLDGLKPGLYILQAATGMAMRSFKVRIE